MLSLVFLPRAGPFHSPKVQSSQPFAHSSGSFKQQSLLSTPQKPNASLSLKTNGLHSTGPKNPKSSNNFSSSAQEPDLNSPLKANQKKKKKKKRRHSEVEAEAEPVASPATATPANIVESASEKKRKKKKKKRKRDNEDVEKVKERECVPSHLDNQEEDWCQGGMWSLTSNPDTEASRQEPLLTSVMSTQCESSQKEQEMDSEKLKKKKKKKKKMQLAEALKDTTSACSAAEMWVEVYNSNCFANIVLVCWKGAHNVVSITTSWPYHWTVLRHL